MNKTKFLIIFVTIILISCSANLNYSNQRTQQKSKYQFGFILDNLTEIEKEYFCVDKGVIILDIVPNSTAESYDIKKDGVIIKVNESYINDSESFNNKINSLGDEKVINIQIIDKKLNMKYYQISKNDMIDLSNNNYFGIYKKNNFKEFIVNNEPIVGSIVDLGLRAGLNKIIVTPRKVYLNYYLTVCRTKSEYFVINNVICNENQSSFFKLSGLNIGEFYHFEGNNNYMTDNKYFTLIIDRPMDFITIEGIKGKESFTKTYKFTKINLNNNNSILDLSHFCNSIPFKNLLPIQENNDNGLTADILLISPELINNIFRTDGFDVIIKGKAIDNDGIFQVYINNETASIKSNGQFQKRIKLKIGKNPIEIKAIDINDNETTKEFLIIREEIIEEEEFSDIDFALKTSNNKPNAIAVVLGIEEYQYAPNVSNAYNDAEIMREYLISTFGLKRKNIYFRYNERATKGEFDKVFSENGWIAKNAEENSEIYVFYAGHGVASINNKSAYLIPNDIDPNYASTGYSLNELYQNLSKINSKSTTIILDACFSGISRENEMLLADSRPISIEVKQGSIPNNLNVFTASSGSEISSGFSQKMHGLFTYFFLKGLNKNADTNNDKKITYGEMEQYLKENVSSQARKMGREQNPQLHTSDKDNILLKY